MQYPLFSFVPLAQFNNQRNHSNHVNERLSLHKFSAMKQLLFLSIILMVLSSCHFTTGSGNIITEKRVTGNFNGISVSSGFDVELKTGPVTEIIVEADDNIMQYIETTVSADILKIGIENMHSLSDAHLKVYITAPEITSIKASSGADVVSRDVLKNDGKLSFNASSAASIVTDLDAPEVAANTSSGASITLRGKTKNYHATASSGANLKTEDLLTENTVVTASSGGKANVHASVSLSATASSGANVNYRGAANVQKTVSSGGSVDKKD